MTEYVPVIICPKCNTETETNSYMISYVLGESTYYDPVKVVCNICEEVFFPHENWKPIKKVASN